MGECGGLVVVSHLVGWASDGWMDGWHCEMNRDGGKSEKRKVRRERGMAGMSPLFLCGESMGWGLNLGSTAG